MGGGCSHCPSRERRLKSAWGPAGAGTKARAGACSLPSSYLGLDCLGARGALLAPALLLLGKGPAQRQARAEAGGKAPGGRVRGAPLCLPGPRCWGPLAPPGASPTAPRDTEGCCGPLVSGVTWDGRGRGMRPGAGSWPAGPCSLLRHPPTCRHNWGPTTPWWVGGGGVPLGARMQAMYPYLGAQCYLTLSQSGGEERTWEGRSRPTQRRPGGRGSGGSWQMVWGSECAGGHPSADLETEMLWQRWRRGAQLLQPAGPCACRFWAAVCLSVCVALPAAPARSAAAKTNGTASRRRSSVAGSHASAHGLPCSGKTGFASANSPALAVSATPAPRAGRLGRWLGVTGSLNSAAASESLSSRCWGRARGVGPGQPSGRQAGLPIPSQV